MKKSTTQGPVSPANYLEALSDSRCGAPLLGVIHALLKFAICCSAVGGVSTCRSDHRERVLQHHDRIEGLLRNRARTEFGIMSTLSLSVAEASIYWTLSLVTNLPALLGIEVSRELFTAEFHTMFFKTDVLSSLLLAVVAYAAFRILLLVRKKEPHPMPPGPKPWPILGNITDLPKTGVREWEFWLEHKNKYGECRHFYIHWSTCG